MTLDVEQLAARWVLEAIPSCELPAAAVQALSDGHDGPSLRQLAGEINPIRSDVSLLVECALVELGAPKLSRRDAALVLASRLAARIVDGSQPPYDGARQIWRLRNDVPELDHEFDPFIYWASEFEEASDEERKQFCIDAILASARDLGGHSA